MKSEIQPLPLLNQSLHGPRPLTALTRDAVGLAQGPVELTLAEAELARQMHVCSDCRYCDGFCAVFPLTGRRAPGSKADLHYLANLCHSCGACLHVCQYVPPHELAVTLPQAMARVRGQTYVDYAWPAALGALYQRNGLTLSLALAAALTLFLGLIALLNGSLSAPPQSGGFYAIFPHHWLVSLFAPVFLFALLALGIGVRRFWRDVTPGAPVRVGQISGDMALAATADILRLTYLDGGRGVSCSDPDPDSDAAAAPWRRRCHHATFYGFLLCFAATSVATVYHYLGWAAPYDLPSLPKLLGVAGGLSLLGGTAGLFALNLKRHPLHGEVTQKPMDRGFMALLFFTSLSGLALWLGRGTAALPTLMAAHLGLVMALFLTLPYGKFAHGIFRSAALLKWALEKRQTREIPPGSH